MERKARDKQEKAKRKTWAHMGRGKRDDDGFMQFPGEEKKLSK